MRAWERFGRPQSPPPFVFGLGEKTCADLSADRYRPVFDGFRGPDSAVKTYLGGLRVGVGYVLILEYSPNTVFSMSKKPRLFFKNRASEKNDFVASCSFAHKLSRSWRSCLSLGGRD